MTRQRPRTKRRYGWTLVELVCVISVLVTITGVVAAFLGGAHRFQSATQSQLQFHATVDRLATQFRRDVRDSVSVTVADQAITLAQIDNRSVVYRHTDEGVVRAAVEPELPDAREGFWLPENWQTSWDHDEPFVTLSLTPALNATTSGPIKIKAVLGGNVIPADS